MSVKYMGRDHFLERACSFLMGQEVREIGIYGAVLHGEFY
jgi:hypothetical protein